MCGTLWYLVAGVARQIWLRGSFFLQPLWYVRPADQLEPYISDLATAEAMVVWMLAGLSNRLGFEHIIAEGDSLEIYSYCLTT
jgi:hypothetical protein